MLTDWLRPLPLIAILRGLRPAEAADVGGAMLDAGFRLLEVPLNSPEPLHSIRILAELAGARALVGAGTVMRVDDVQQVAEAGGRLIVMPHADTRVIAAARDAGLVCTPGVATVTEAFAALEAGAAGLKLFPAGQVGPAGLKAWRAVLPPEVAVLPVGGVGTDNMRPWLAAGAAGFGIGSALYKPGMTTADVSARAQAFASAWRAADKDIHA